MSRSRLTNAATIRRIAAAVGAGALVAMGAATTVAGAEPARENPAGANGATTTQAAPPTVPLTPSASPVVKAAPYGKS
ncbi:MULTISPECIES: hypothetical protein [Mycobacteriaceae]|uniref:Uncharacterized protein n=1 Tax=Mycolicibacterium mucogenicum DSM 44124 TaxID=1226753 RepID=A0A8H2PGQ8_MYCMU|nr:MULTISPECIES: hypothetical protein [Mycobacteriaceae]KAB7758697.1 hypothetical protein MMUC44124_11415 [Mycolicibacterium mucogenicum DSM 44124]QPG67730.1 hypothetical protein C1S78_019605 [Mycolicibacterium mucogenicum DSM 44124]SEA28793.1 hypothetical protein SAMN04488580_102260 [Mycobacterium sp. 283mftsu]